MRTSRGPWLEKIYELYDKGRRGELLREVRAAWRRNKGRTAELGEGCRFARLAALKNTPGPETPELWEVRALSCFALAGSMTGVAMIVMNRSFAVAHRLGPARLADALAVLDEMKPLLEAADLGSVPSLDLCWRVYYEKRGYFLYALGRYREATASYRRALPHTKAEKRGELKVRAAQALCVALMGDREAAGRLTERLLAEAEERKYDLVEPLRANLNVLLSRKRRVRREDFEPYETL